MGSVPRWPSVRPKSCDYRPGFLCPWTHAHEKINTLPVCPGACPVGFQRCGGIRAGCGSSSELHNVRPKYPVLGLGTDPSIVAN